MNFFCFLGRSLLCLVAACAIAVAQEIRLQGPTVLLNEVPVVTLRTWNAGISPENRAIQVSANLASIANLRSVAIRRSGRNFQVVAGSRLIVTVTPAEARAAGTTMSSLATSWARRIRQAAAVPPLRLSTNQLRVAVGRSKSFTISGLLASEAGVSSDQRDVAVVHRIGNQVAVQAVGAGNATISVYARDQIRIVELESKPYAANFPQSIAVSVVGNPAIASMVEGAVRGAIRNQFLAVPGARYSFNLNAVEAVGLGDTRTIPVRVEVSGPDAFPTNGIVNVVVRNTLMPVEPDSELWYCNDPESVSRAQGLFAARLRRDRPARLLYHHVNVSGSPLMIRVKIVNDSDVPARVILTPGDSTPDRNPVLAGIQAAEQFFRYWLTGSGEVVTIPAQSSIPVSIRRLWPQETMSGLCSIRLVDGPGDVLIRTDSILQFDGSEDWKAAMRSSAPWREVGSSPISQRDLRRQELSPYVFPNPNKPEESWTYRVGERHQFIRVGERAIPRYDNEQLLSGNFGVIYNIRATLENPTTEPTIIDVRFIPSAGYSGGLFVLNGNLLRSPLLQPQQPWRIARIRLGAGERRSFRLQTLPLSGSSYPVTLQIGAADLAADAAASTDVKK